MEVAAAYLPEAAGAARFPGSATTSGKGQGFKFGILLAAAAERQTAGGLEGEVGGDVPRASGSSRGEGREESAESLADALASLIPQPLVALDIKVKLGPGDSGAALDAVARVAEVQPEAGGVGAGGAATAVAPRLMGSATNLLAEAQEALASAPGSKGLPDAEVAEGIATGKPMGSTAETPKSSPGETPQATVAQDPQRPNGAQPALVSPGDSGRAGTAPGEAVDKAESSGPRGAEKAEQAERKEAKSETGTSKERGPSLGDVKGDHGARPAAPPGKDRGDERINPLAAAKAGEARNFGLSVAAQVAKGHEPEVPASEVLDQLLAHAAKLSVPGNTSLRIQLSPASLGSLDLRLGLHEGMLRLHIRAESGQALELIEKALPELVQALQQKAIEVGQISLSPGGTWGGSGAWPDGSTASWGAGNQWSGERRPSGGSPPSTLPNDPESADLDRRDQGRNQESYHLVDRWV